MWQTPACASFFPSTEYGFPNVCSLFNVSVMQQVFLLKQSPNHRIICVKNSCAYTTAWQPLIWIHIPLMLEPGALLTSCRWRHEEINWEALDNCSEFILNTLVNLSCCGNLSFVEFSACNEQPHLLSHPKAVPGPWREGRWNLEKESTEQAMRLKDKCCGKKNASTELC